MVASLASIGSAHRLGEGSVLEDLTAIDAGIDDALLLRAEVLIEWVEEHEVPAEPDWCGSAPGECHAGPSFTSPEYGVDEWGPRRLGRDLDGVLPERPVPIAGDGRSEEHTSELQSRFDLVCRLLLEKKKLYIQ